MGRKTNAQIEQEVADRAAALDAAVSAKVAEILPGAVNARVTELIEAQLAEARATAGTSADNAVAKAGDRALVEGLAMAMQKVADPGNKRRILSPEIMRQREEAWERMLNLLIEYHASERMPVYRVLNKVFLAEVFVEPQFQDPKTKEMKDQEINWNQVPNLALEPVNDDAKAVMREFLLSIGSVATDATKMGAPWVMSAGQLLRGKSGTERGHVGAPVNFDPRRMTIDGKTVRKTINVLGTAAEPAIMSG